MSAASTTYSHAAKLGRGEDTRSQYKKELDLDTGEPVLACPYGCGLAEVDEYGMCEHLIGFTNSRLPEGEVRKGDGSEIEVLSKHGVFDDFGRRMHTNERQKLKKGDFLVRITCTSRVYRDNGKRPGEPVEEETAADE
jgi:hypothetical protein